MNQVSDPARQRQVTWQFAKFVAIGVLNTAVGYAIYATLVLLGLFEQVALAIAFSIGVAWNYLTHARLVFDYHGANRFPVYAAAYILIYLSNAIGLHWLTGAGYSPLFAQALIAPAAAVMSFVFISRILTKNS